MHILVFIDVICSFSSAMLRWQKFSGYFREPCRPNSAEFVLIIDDGVVLNKLNKHISEIEGEEIRTCSSPGGRGTVSDSSMSSLSDS